MSIIKKLYDLYLEERIKQKIIGLNSFTKKTQIKSITIFNLNKFVFEKKYDHSEIVKELLFYESSDSMACVLLGVCYQSGIWDFDLDKKKSFNYYEKAAVLGDSFGMYYLGICYYLGIGVNVEINNAFECYSKAVEMGSIDACVSLGYFYFKGIGTEKNEKKGFFYLKKAMDNGNATGTYNVAFCYYHGCFVEKNVSKAKILFEKCAELGHSSGNNCIGNCYLYEGEIEKSFFYYKKAVKQNNIYALNNLADLYLDDSNGKYYDEYESYLCCKKAVDLLCN